MKLLTRGSTKEQRLFLLKGQGVPSMGGSGILCRILKILSKGGCYFLHRICCSGNAKLKSHLFDNFFASSFVKILSKEIRCG